MAAPYYGMIEDVRVMLVDNDKEFVTEMVDLLKSFDYKVTTVGTTSAAMSLLSKEREKIDVIIIHAHSSNMLSLELLAKTVAMDIISLFVCDEDNELVPKKALEAGASLYLKSPFDKEIVKYLWQFVLRKQIQRPKVREESKIKRDQIMNVAYVSIEEQRNDIQDAENDVGSNEKYKLTMKRGRKNMNEFDKRESQSSDINMVVRKKACKLWNHDRHAKFMKAVEQIGKKKCHPKKILELMNVPDLTRTQVASHLQSCRLYNWKIPEDKKVTRHPSGQRSSNIPRQKNSLQKAGRTPFLQANVPNLQHDTNQTKNVREFPVPTINSNNIFLGGGSSIQQLYHPQFQAQSHYRTFDNPFNNSFLSTQNNFKSGLQQQQHGLLYGVLDPQGLQKSIIENTSYRPNLAFNNGYHSTQGDCNLNHNVSHGATYSGTKTISSTNLENPTFHDSNLNANSDNVTTCLGRGMILDANAENTTVHGLGAVNTKFQQDSSKSKMSNPSNLVVASNERDIEKSDATEKENWDAYFDFNNIDYLSQNLEPSSTLPSNE